MWRDNLLIGTRVGKLHTYLLIPELLRLTPLPTHSLSRFRCLELLFRATPKDKEQGDLDSQFSSFLLEVRVVNVLPLCVLAHYEV